MRKNKGGVLLCHHTWPKIQQCLVKKKNTARHTFHLIHFITSRKIALKNFPVFQLLKNNTHIIPSLTLNKSGKSVSEKKQTNKKKIAVCSLLLLFFSLGRKIKSKANFNEEKVKARLNMNYSGLQKTHCWHFVPSPLRHLTSQEFSLVKRSARAQKRFHCP